MKKSIKNVMAFALAASMAASTFAPATTVSAASKSNVITKATYNSGATVKYSYNKKGLITKAVSTSSSKSNNSDTSETVTTTFKYNKKNKIASKTEKDVTKVTSYEVDKTTGLKLGAKTGTVTTTKTTVTTFKYDKKGLATESVATTTTGMSGSITETEKSPAISATEIEMNGGTKVYLGGYNKYKEDGTKYDENTSANAYYYEGSIEATEGTQTTTTTYTDKGNGVYNKTKTTSNSVSGYKSESVDNYYGKYYDSASNSEKIVALTYKEDGFEKEVEEKEWDSATSAYVNKKVKKTYSFQTPDGKDFFDNTQVPGSSKNTFTITQKVVITADPTSTSTSTKTESSDISKKKVTTTKYTYDKKKRVKKAVSTTVSTNKNQSTENNSSSSTSATGSSKSDKSSKSESLKESTSVVTTAFTYNKKGRATKVVTSNDGKEDSKSVVSNMTVSSSSESTSKNSDNTVDVDKSSSSYECAAGYPTVTTTVVKDGVSTVTTTKNPYKYTLSSENSSKTYSNKGSEIDDITFFGNGGKKTVSTYEGTSSYTYGSTTTTTTKKGTKTSYNFDEKGKVSGYIDEYKSSTNGEAAKDNTEAHYSDGKDSFSNDTAVQKVNEAKGQLEASGTTCNKVDGTKAVLPTPSKSTTTYKYDKAGNVKSAKCSGTTTSIENVKNETYGNDIYEWDAKGELVAKETPVTHKFTDNDAMENTVKKGTKVLTKKLVVSKGTQDRSSSSSSYLSRALYTIKGKKATASKVANKQQWIIQNGALNGEVGLN